MKTMPAETRCLWIKHVAATPELTWNKDTVPIELLRASTPTNPKDPTKKKGEDKEPTSSETK